MHLQEQLPLQGVDILYNFFLIRPRNPLEGPQHAEDIVFNSLCLPDKEVLSMAFLFDGAEALLHVPVLCLDFFEDFSGNSPALIPIGQVPGVVPHVAFPWSNGQVWGNQLCTHPVGQAGKKEV